MDLCRIGPWIKRVALPLWSDETEEMKKEHFFKHNLQECIKSVVPRDVPYSCYIRYRITSLPPYFNIFNVFLYPECFKDV